MVTARTAAAIYFAMAIAGAYVPLMQIAPFVQQHGFDFGLAGAQLVATPVSRFFGVDVVWSAVALIVFIVIQGPRDRVALAWLAVVATLGIGVSCGLPLFLGLRERALMRA